MARYYLHRKFLLLNPDGICIAPPADREEAWFRTLFVGLSGGQVFLGDRFDLAEPEIRSYVRKVLPPYGEAAKPVDLFLKPYPDARPEILHLHTPTHEIVGLFQFTNDSNISLNFNDLCMNGKYEVWEFYERKYLGVVDTEQPFAYPMACPTARLLFFTPVSSEPQVIATDFHITGGTVELQKLHYDAATLTLSGELCRPSGDKGSLYVSVPERLTCNLPQAAPGVVELKLQATSEPLHWSIPFQSN